MPNEGVDVDVGEEFGEPPSPYSVHLRVDPDSGVVTTVRRFAFDDPEEATAFAGALDADFGRLAETPSFHRDINVEVHEPDGEVELTITLDPIDGGAKKSGVLGAVATCVEELYAIALQYGDEEAEEVAWFNYQAVQEAVDD